jgi:hypothetical protein
VWPMTGGNAILTCEACQWVGAELTGRVHIGCDAGRRIGQKACQDPCRREKYSGRMLGGAPVEAGLALLLRDLCGLLSLKAVRSEESGVCPFGGPGDGAGRFVRGDGLRLRERRRIAGFPTGRRLGWGTHRAPGGPTGPPTGHTSWLDSRSARAGAGCLESGLGKAPRGRCGLALLQTSIWL